MRNFFKRKEPIIIPAELVEEADRNLPLLETLQATPGWELVRGWVVDEVNASIGEWVKGVEPDRARELASRVKAFDWFLGLVDSRVELYKNLHREMLREGVNEDSATTAFLDPHDEGE